MKSDVTFNKVKLTNNNMDQNGHVSTQRTVRLRGRYDRHRCWLVRGIDLMREAVVSLPSPCCSAKLPRGGEQLE